MNIYRALVDLNLKATCLVREYADGEIEILDIEEIEEIEEFENVIRK